MNFALSPAENAFVDSLIELGDANEAAVAAGVQPSIAHDPRVQSALVEQIRVRGAVDAVYARKILRDLAKQADNDSVRLRAATTLWERGLGKVPDQINLDVNLKGLDRATLYAEIRQLIGELGLPPALEGEFEEVVGEAHALSHDPEPAGVAQTVERECVQSTEVAGSSPAAGTTAPDTPVDAGPALAGTYIPPLPNKWK